DRADGECRPPEAACGECTRVPGPSRQAEFRDATLLPMSPVVTPGIGVIVSQVRPLVGATATIFAATRTGSRRSSCPPSESLPEAHTMPAGSVGCPHRPRGSPMRFCGGSVGDVGEEVLVLLAGLELVGHERLQLVRE